MTRKEKRAATAVKRQAMLDKMVHNVEQRIGNGTFTLEAFQQITSDVYVAFHKSANPQDRHMVVSIMQQFADTIIDRFRSKIKDAPMIESTKCIIKVEV